MGGTSALSIQYLLSAGVFCHPEMHLVVNLDCKEIQALIRKIVPEAESAILVLDQEGNPVTCVNAAAEELMREPELLSRLTAAKIQFWMLD